MGCSRIFLERRFYHTIKLCWVYYISCWFNKLLDINIIMEKKKDNIIKFPKRFKGKRKVVKPDENLLRLNEDISFADQLTEALICLLYTSPSPRDSRVSRMPSSA